MRDKKKQALKCSLKTKSFKDKIPQAKHVIIIKHFQPRVIYDCARFNNQTLPEVNADVDTSKDLNIPKTVVESSLKPPRIPRKKLTRSVVVNNKLQNNVLHKLKAILSPEFKSKSYVENKVCTPKALSLKSKSFDDHKMYTHSQKCREANVCLPHASKLNKPERKINFSKSRSEPDHSTLSKKSTTETIPLKKSNTTATSRKKTISGAERLPKSDVVNTPQKSDTVSSLSSWESKKICIKKSDSFSKSYRKKVEQKRNRFTSSSESEKNCDYITCLKSEIVLSKALTLTSSNDTIDSERIRSRQKRINALRNEINELVSLNSNKKRNQILELKSEIAEFRRNVESVCEQNIEDINKKAPDNIVYVQDVQQSSALETEPREAPPEIIVNKILKESTKENEEKYSSVTTLTTADSKKR